LAKRPPQLINWHLPSTYCTATVFTSSLASTLRKLWISSAEFIVIFKTAQQNIRYKEWTWQIMIRTIITSSSTTTTRRRTFVDQGRQYGGVTFNYNHCDNMSS
jgi:hypothetical protein